MLASVRLSHWWRRAFEEGDADGSGLQDGFALRQRALELLIEPAAFADVGHEHQQRGLAVPFDARAVDAGPAGAQPGAMVSRGGVMKRAS
jgi:hypothetical protein